MCSKGLIWSLPLNKYETLRTRTERFHRNEHNFTLSEHFLLRLFERSRRTIAALNNVSIIDECVKSEVLRRKILKQDRFAKNDLRGKHFKNLQRKAIFLHPQHVWGAMTLIAREKPEHGRNKKKSVWCVVFFSAQESKMHKSSLMLKNCKRTSEKRVLFDHLTDSKTACNKRSRMLTPCGWCWKMIDWNIEVRWIFEIKSLCLRRL